MSVLNYVPYLPSCRTYNPRALRAFPCFTCLVPYMPSCLKCLVPCFLSCLPYFVPYLLSCLTWLALYILLYLMCLVLSCLTSFMPYVLTCLTCLTWSLALRVSCLTYSRVSWASYLFTCSHATPVFCLKLFCAAGALWRSCSFAPHPSVASGVSSVTYSYVSHVL